MNVAQVSEEIFHSEPTPPERELWCDVIMQAFRDACALGTVTPLETRKARNWLTGNSGGFRDVCLAANVEPDAVRGKAEELKQAAWAPDSIRWNQTS